jgi:hypothetical protein
LSTQIAKLEALLSRVQERAAVPRVQAPAAEEDAFVLEASVPPPAAEKPRMAMAVPPLAIPDLDEPDFDVDVDVDVEFEDEPVPESGQVSNDTMERAMQAADDAAPLTPPPESGEDIARPQIPRNAGPTMEQLGQTISLDESGPQDFELDDPDFDDNDFDEEREEATLQINRSDIDALKVQSTRSFEADISSLKKKRTEELRSPEESRAELERLTLGEPTPIEARISKRPAVHAAAVELVSASRSFAPKTFVELLDASLSLK